MSIHGLRERLDSERGFTLIEVLASAAILAIGVFALVASFDQSRGLANQSESQVSATAIAERQLDAGLAVPFNRVALSTAAPSTTGSSDDQKWNNVLNYGTETAAATLSPIVPDPATANTCSNIVSPGFTGFNELLPNRERNCIVSCPSASGYACPTGSTPGAVIPYSVVNDARGARYKVYRYVTWVNDVPCGAVCLNPGLPVASVGADVNPWFGDYKRLTIAVQVLSRNTGNAPTISHQGLKKPVVVQAVKIDPSRGLGNANGSPLPPGAIQ